MRSLTYRALAGDWWDATVLQTRADGTVDIEVDRTKLSRIGIHRGHKTDCPAGTCMEIQPDGEAARAHV